jgi:signal transduction histidine kinase
VIGTATPLRHALDVLIENALVHGAGSVRVEHQVGETTVTISVSDEGPGFTPSADTAYGSSEPEGLAEASTSTAPERDDSDETRAVPDPLQGADQADTGIGLPLARRLVESMQGRLTIARRGPEPRVEIALERADRDQ